MKNNVKTISVRVLSGLCLLLASFYAYDMYKSISGFVANGFRESAVMLTMILSFFLPILCFFVHFYDFYVKNIHRVAKIVVSSLAIIYAAVMLVLIFLNIELFVSNNKYGVYDALPSIFVHFPYDMIIVHFALIAFSVLCIVNSAMQKSKLISFIDSLKGQGFFKCNTIEYIALCFFAFVSFIFIGASITATFTSFANAFFDIRYLFLLIWVFLIPAMNLAFLVVKPYKMEIPMRAKVISLSLGIFVNLLLSILLLVFELTYPNFIVHVGKPLFLIAFSVSLPIEVGIILAITLFGTVFLLTKLILLLVKKK